ncbi:MAG: ABC transporter permease subunit [Rhodobacteraceae bacterium]|nr:ABC transporter permease subunit [Paracoccaceae bacterium]
MTRTLPIGAGGLRLLAWTVLAGGILLPIAAGLWQTARAALGVMPAIGADAPGWDAAARLLALPGLGRSVAVTLFTGAASTLLALVLAAAVAALWHERLRGRAAARWLAPYLAAPHAALAIGLAFLLAPSGWIARALAPLAGWERPPDIASVNDPAGLALILGLVIKEMPFLLLVMLSALGQLPVARHLALGRSLGYGRGAVWLRVILPQVWPLVRLPVMVVLAYGLSVVDMALILGPSNPPTLSVLLLRLFTAPDTAALLPASAGALLQLALVLAAFGVLLVLERLARSAGRAWLARGWRGQAGEALLRLATGLALTLFVLGAVALVSLGLWSVAWRWPWPALLPTGWTTAFWAAPGSGLWRALADTAILAAGSTVLALALAVAWLEGEDRAGRPGPGRRGAGWAEVAIYLPLLLPQIAFLFGLNVLFLRMGLSGGHVAVIWAHALFVFPYVMIALSQPWRALDPRLARAAAALGAGPWRRLWAVKLPALAMPLSVAAAIGLAVSVSQYLPTLFMGAGRIATLTTEAVTLSSGADRRITAVWASLQAVLPWLAYGAALMLPGLMRRGRGRA